MWEGDGGCRDHAGSPRGGGIIRGSIEEKRLMTSGLEKLVGCKRLGSVDRFGAWSSILKRTLQWRAE